jgi:hypothetical protein
MHCQLAPLETRTIPRSILTCESLAILLDNAGGAFLAGHEAVEKYNARLQRRQVRWGRLYRLWRRLTWR